MISRREAMLGLASLAVTGPAGGGLSFRVNRNGQPIGVHELTFNRSGTVLMVQISVEIEVRFGPFTLYRYALHGREEWHGDQFAILSARTNDDGEPAFVEATRDHRGIWVRGSAGPPYVAPVDAIPGTHWNKVEMHGPWINPQDGKLLRQTATLRGQDKITVARGASVTADHFTVVGDAPMELWYDLAGQWSALRAPAKDGSVITYALT